MVAGGTDLAGALQIEGDRIRKVVSIADLDELRGVSLMPDGGVRIGALTTLADVAISPVLTRPHAALSKATTAFADAELRSRATLGGNLCQRPRCWYLRSNSVCARKGGDLCLAADGENRYHGILGGSLCHMVHPSDLAPALIALDARARIVGPSGLRFVPLDAFFLPPTQSLERENVLAAAEILTDVLMPKPPAGLRSTYRRVSEAGVDYALASVSVAASVRNGHIEHARVALGAAAPVPWRSHDAEAILAGARPGMYVARAAANTAVADARPLADNRYKVALFKDILTDAIADVLGVSDPDAAGASG